MTVSPKLWRGVAYAIGPSLFIWAMIGFAFSQEPSPRDRALTNRINIEIANNIACSTATQELLDRIRDLEAKLAEATKDKKD